MSTPTRPRRSVGRVIFIIAAVVVVILIVLLAAASFAMPLLFPFQEHGIQPGFQYGPHITTPQPTHLPGSR